MTPLMFTKGLADPGNWGEKLFGRIMTEEMHLGEGWAHKACRVKVIYGLDPIFESGSTCIAKVRNLIAYGTKEESQLIERNLVITKQVCYSLPLLWFSFSLNSVLELLGHEKRLLQFFWGNGSMTNHKIYCSYITYYNTVKLKVAMVFVTGMQIQNMSWSRHVSCLSTTVCSELIWFHTIWTKKIFFPISVMQNAKHNPRVLQNLCCWGSGGWKLWPCTRVSEHFLKICIVLIATYFQGRRPRLILMHSWFMTQFESLCL